MSNFEIDLFTVWEVSKIHLPNMAEVFSESATEVYDEACESGAKEYFRYPHTGKVSGVYSVWNDLVSALQKAQANTANNLLDTASALDEFIDDISEQDSAAAADLDSQIDERLDNKYHNPQPAGEVERPPNVSDD